MGMANFYKLSELPSLQVTQLTNNSTGLKVYQDYLFELKGCVSHTYANDM